MASPHSTVSQSIIRAAWWWSHVMHWGDVIGVQCGVISNHDDGDVAGGDAVSSSRHYNRHPHVQWCCGHNAAIELFSFRSSSVFTKFGDYGISTGNWDACSQRSSLVGWFERTLITKLSIGDCFANKDHNFRKRDHKDTLLLWIFESTSMSYEHNWRIGELYFGYNVHVQCSNTAPNRI